MLVVGLDELRILLVDLLRVLARRAEQELLQDKIALVKAEHDEALALLQVRASIGQLTAEGMRLPVAIYDPDKNYNKVRNQWLGFANEKE